MFILCKWLNTSHKYYHQVQVQLFVTKARFCDFVVWSPTELHIERILLSPSYLPNSSVLHNFYFEHMRPYLVKHYFWLNPASKTCAKEQLHAVEQGMRAWFQRMHVLYVMLSVFSAMTECAHSRLCQCKMVFCYSIGECSNIISIMLKCEKNYVCQSTDLKYMKRCCQLVWSNHYTTCRSHQKVHTYGDSTSCTHDTDEAE